MGGLGRPGKFLCSVHEHEKEIEGTEEEFRYYSHDSSEQIEDEGMGNVSGIQVFKVDEEPERKHSGKCSIRVVDDKGYVIGTQTKRFPTTLSIFNEVAKAYNIKQYVLKTIEGKLIKGASTSSVILAEVYLEDLEYAISEFNMLNKKGKKSKNILICPICNHRCLSGETLTINKNNLIVHLSCDIALNEKEKKIRLNKMTKSEILKELRSAFRNDNRYNDYAILTHIGELFGKTHSSSFNIDRSTRDEYIERMSKEELVSNLQLILDNDWNDTYNVLGNIAKFIGCEYYQEHD